MELWIFGYPRKRSIMIPPIPRITSCRAVSYLAVEVCVLKFYPFIVLRFIPFKEIVWYRIDTNSFYFIFPDLNGLSFLPPTTVLCGFLPKGFHGPCCGSSPLPSVLTLFCDEIPLRYSKVIATIGTLRSADERIVSPANIPKPPLYVWIFSSIPISIEK
jgi:hypothetical protein